MGRENELDELKRKLNNIIRSTLSTAVIVFFFFVFICLPTLAFFIQFSYTVKKTIILDFISHSLFSTISKHILVWKNKLIEKKSLSFYNKAALLILTKQTLMGNYILRLESKIYFLFHKKKTVRKFRNGESKCWLKKKSKSWFLQCSFIQGRDPFCSYTQQRGVIIWYYWRFSIFQHRKQST